jgi:hypothetical protein
MTTSKTIFKQLLRASNLNFKQFKQIQNFNKQSKFSSFNEEQVISNFLKQIDIKHNFFVDIGAANGVSWSNTCLLAMQGWKGLSVEYNSEEFAELAEEYKCFSGINLSRCMVTPDNVVSLLNTNQVPREFGVLSLDIDSYDYYVLEEILKAYRPCIICTEVNHIIPPPIKFTVKWDPKYNWNNQDNCHGQSLSQLNFLATKYDYGIAHLEFNNAFLIPQKISEINKIPLLSPEEAFQKGFLERCDRAKKFPYGKDLEAVYGLSPEEAFSFINKAFAKHEGKYICSL